MLENTRSPSPAMAGAKTRCRKTGHFIAKGGCFAVHESSGGDLWLDINPVPLHMLDEEVEITGQQFGADHIWVEAIGPLKARS